MLLDCGPAVEIFPSAHVCIVQHMNSARLHEALCMPLAAHISLAAELEASHLALPSLWFEIRSADQVDKSYACKCVKITQPSDMKSHWLGDSAALSVSRLRAKQVTVP